MRFLLHFSLKKFISFFSLNISSHNVPWKLWNNYLSCHSVHFILHVLISARKRFYIQYKWLFFKFLFFSHFQDIIHSVFVHSFLHFTFSISLHNFPLLLFFVSFSFPRHFTFFLLILFLSAHFFPFSPSLFLSFFFLHLTRATCRKSVVAYSFPVSHVLLILGYSVVRYLLFSRLHF